MVHRGAKSQTQLKRVSVDTHSSEQLQPQKSRPCLPQTHILMEEIESQVTEMSACRVDCVRGAWGRVVAATVVVAGW